MKGTKATLLTGLVVASIALTGCGQSTAQALNLNKKQDQNQTQANVQNISAMSMQEKISQDIQSLQNFFGRGHRRNLQQDANLQQWGQQANQLSDQLNQQLQQQLNQLMNEAQQFNQHAMLRKMSHRIGLRRLPKQSNNYGQQNVNGSGVQVTAGDRRVSQATLQSAGQIVQQISLPILKENVGLPASGTHLVLFSSQQSYAQALVQAGVPQQQLQSIVSNTGGLTIGNDIWIPLYNLQDKSDLANVLTHELTHVVLNQKGIGDTIPTWVNEGMAWHDGMLALNQVNPNKAKQEAAELTKQVQDAKQNGKLLPLTASEDDILTADYNVEWTDYLAIQNLISQDQNGPAKIDAFLNGIAKQGVDNSFQAQYGQSITQYEKEFTQTL
ncbi:MAG: hypothetical protein ACXVP5_01580 [Tumebacillaceae bacterium]